ncbi:PaaI family thioesterase [Cohnella terricola]|uniref:PaaI family thioesterase n=1 Tax=Cohnella terricola TaxID=1289167 RepID=A0A559JG11_9BACL|nr:PaaI family thioesterase [Cohnella terricola]TVX98805.1 PaaI family thioesterase [Cohnella terricola]
MELKINFLKPVWSGAIRAEAKVMKKGQTVGFIDCSVFDENQSLEEAQTTHAPA